MSNNTNKPLIFTLEDPVEYRIDNVCMVTRSDCIRVDGPAVEAEVVAANLKAPSTGAVFSLEDPVEYAVNRAPQVPIR